MSLDQETIGRIAKLARLKLKEGKIEAMQKDLNNILHFIDQLNEVDTRQVEALSGVNIPAMPMREDVIRDGDKVEKILVNAPEVACHMFVVPKVVE